MKARPVPLGLRSKLREMLQDMDERKIIEKSSSAWAFPIVLVEKEDGSLRLCIDYRELNKCISLDSYPMPTIDAVLQNMAGKLFFYNPRFIQWVLVNSAGRGFKRKNSVCYIGGIVSISSNAIRAKHIPCFFQRMMDTVLHDLLGGEVFCYFCSTI